MSKGDTLLERLGDSDAVPSEQDLNVSPSWSLQNFTFSLPPFKAKQRPKIALPKTLSPISPLPPLPLDGFLESPRGNKDFGFCWRSAEEQVYNPHPLRFGEAEAFGGDSQAAWALRSPSTDTFEKYCCLDRVELEQSASSEVTHNAPGSALDLACPASDGSDVEGIRESCSESTGDGQWEGVVKLVQELTARLESNHTGNPESADQKSDYKMGAQPIPEGKASAQELKSLELAKKSCDGEDILLILSNIEGNVHKLKDAVPKIRDQRHGFNVLVHRQCAAAVGTIRLISQLAEAAVAIIPEIHREIQREIQRGVESAGWNSLVIPNVNERCKESSPVSPNPQVSSALKLEDGIGESVGMDTLMPALAAVSMSPANVMPGYPVRGSCGDGAEETKPNFQLERVAENEFASSLLADLLAPCDRGVGGFLPPASTSGTPFRLDQWGNDLDEAIRTSNVPQLSLDAQPFDNPAIRTSSVRQLSLDAQSFENPADTSPSNEEPTTGDSCAAAAHDDSDEGDTKPGDQLPVGAFTVMEIDDMEILTEQTHYCSICSKGFKRDANLRMHMRSHGGKYKASTALGKSERAPKVVQEMVGEKLTRFSCPYAGCNRNMKHPKFQALKTMLCLRNHYRRSHCVKTLQCSICKSKQFSVVADLKTHEKHCGSDKWACSCGTTFSRKEKLYGHVSLFVGHVPVDVSTVAKTMEVGDTGAPVLVQTTSDGDASAARAAQAEPVWQDWS